MGPKGVSVDQNGHVIVVDNKACTVFIFQLTGKLITKFGSRGNGDKQFAGNVWSTMPVFNVLQTKLRASSSSSSSSFIITLRLGYLKHFQNEIYVLACTEN